VSLLALPTKEGKDISIVFRFIIEKYGSLRDFGLVQVQTNKRQHDLPIDSSNYPESPSSLPRPSLPLTSSYVLSLGG
jgi:hypothetical protein